MIVPHTTDVGVSPQWEDLTNYGHPPQRAVNQLHDVCITHLLQMKTGEVSFIKCKENNFFKAETLLK